jgi:hypothetical protein
LIAGELKVEITHHHHQEQELVALMMEVVQSRPKMSATERIRGTELLVILTRARQQERAALIQIVQLRRKMIALEWVECIKEMIQPAIQIHAVAVDLRVLAV